MILVVNAGSSSLKFAVFESTASDDLPWMARGRIAWVESRLGLRIETPDRPPGDEPQPASHGDRFDPEQAVAALFRWLESHRRHDWQLAAVGHRVVHGGERFVDPVRVTAAVLRELDALVPLAPLHQPHNLEPIRVVHERWPAVPQVACFDTAFHRTLSPVAQGFALPRWLGESGVRRYGFHGLSYEYVASRLPDVLGDGSARAKVIVAHLGNGASLCAMEGGRSVATTMGFSVLDGLVMGTRCGSLDAGVPLYLMQHRGMSVQQVSDLLYDQSGLLGLSGVSGDMDVLLRSTDPHAVEAIGLFVYRAVTEIGALAAAMGGLDAIVFTGGIGENAAAVRAEICAGCGWLGAALDAAANDAGRALIHRPGSRLQLAIVATDEAVMIARHVVHCVARPG